MELAVIFPSCRLQGCDLIPLCAVTSVTSHLLLMNECVMLFLFGLSANVIMHVTIWPCTICKRIFLFYWRDRNYCWNGKAQTRFWNISIYICLQWQCHFTKMPLFRIIVPCIHTHKQTGNHAFISFTSLMRSLRLSLEQCSLRFSSKTYFFLIPATSAHKQTQIHGLQYCAWKHVELFLFFSLLSPDPVTYRVTNTCIRCVMMNFLMEIHHCQSFRAIACRHQIKVFF